FTALFPLGSSLDLLPPPSLSFLRQPLGCIYSVHARAQGILDKAQKRGSACPWKLTGFPDRKHTG
ncbi:MAG: hypothetical protein ACRDHS_07755, partial [Actinomycetota bacterium]